MKITSIAWIICLLCSFSAFSQHANTKAEGAYIKFEKTTIEFGKIKKGSDPYKIFKFTNTGNAPLVITKCAQSCGCTVPTCPNKVIKPGESSEIKVKYDTNRIGTFNKTVTVKSNATNGNIVLHINGEVLKE